METRIAHCPDCGRQVRLALTPGPAHLGHANLPDGPELVWLDACDCEGGVCRGVEASPAVMAARLARSGLVPEHFTHTRILCEGCDTVAEMEVLDGTHARCTLCGAINRWILDDLVEHGAVPA
jgi:hypothetical protein